MGKFKSSKEEVKNRILKLGGLVVSKITDTTAAAVSSKNEVKKMSARMEDLREKDIEVKILNGTSQDVNFPCVQSVNKFINFVIISR